MNVALTRAKHGLFVVGRASTLSANPTWAALVDFAHRTPWGYLAIPDTRRSVFTYLDGALQEHLADTENISIAMVYPPL